MDELVSVIIPCYNAEKTIERAIRSVFEQTYGNIEIIVINDGSTDNSEEVLLRLKEKSNIKVKYFKQKNFGVSSARNKGINISCGKYVLFIDADDMIVPNMITLLVEALKNTGSDVAYCKYTRKKFDKNKNCIYQIESKKTLLEKQIHKRKNQIGFFTYLYVKEIIFKNQISFPEDIRYGEDNVFIMNYLLFCERGAFINCAMYYYTENPFSAMNNVNWKMVENLDGINLIKKMLEGNEIISFYNEYVFARAIWALLKDFACSGKCDLYERLESEYPVKKYIKKLIFQKQAEPIVRLTSGLYMISSNFFFFLFKNFYNYMKLDNIIKKKR